MLNATSKLATALRKAAPDGDPLAQWRCALRTTLIASWTLGPDAPPAPAPPTDLEALETAFAPYAEASSPRPPTLSPAALTAWHEALPRGLSAAEVAASLAPALEPAATWHTGRTTARYGHARKRQGAYYTPTALIHTLLEELDALPRAPSPLPLRVIDPACGTGALLAALLPREPSALLYGVDLDPLAVELCRLVLDAALAAAGDPTPSAERQARLRQRIRCGDALVGTPPTGHTPRIEPPHSLRRLDWTEAFPEVFAQTDGYAGFDLVLANPPWERLKVEARGLLRDQLPEAARAAHRAERERTLAEHAPHLRDELGERRARAATLSRWLRHSGTLPLSAHGDLNTYALFAERVWQLVAPGGRAALIVPSGLVTDHGHRRLFAALLEAGAIAAVLDFENRARHFPAVDSRFRFALVLLHRPCAGDAARDGIARVATQLHAPEDRLAEGRTWAIRAAELAVCNPRTRTLPMFRTRAALERGLAMHRAVPESGALGLELHRMLDMTRHAHLLRDRAALEQRGLVLRHDDALGQVMADADGSARHLPLIEGKLFWQHDGAAATFAGVPSDARRRGRAVAVPHTVAPRVSEPRFWVEQARVEASAPRTARDADFWLCVRALTNPTNQRTLVAALVPPGAVGNSALLVEVPAARDARSRRHWLPLVCANLNALVLDDLARQKMGNTNVNMYMLEQLPLLSPADWEARLPGARRTLGELVGPRAVALAASACTALAGLTVEPHWNREVRRLQGPHERARAMAEIDALLAWRYGLDEDDLRCVLESFGALQRAECAAQGRFVTAERVLECFRTLEQWACA